MEYKVLQCNHIQYASVFSNEELIFDGQTALDLIASIRYDTGCDRISINREAISSSFFQLRSGLAGEVLQKFINYRTKLAIIGDFSQVASKPLRDLIRESNRGHDIFFVATEDEAGERLCRD